MAINPENRMEQILNGEKLEPQNRTEYFVQKAIENGGGGGGSLPAAGADGNVLTADDGEWVSAAPADATELQFTLTIGESIACDTAVADIINALENKRPVLGIVSGVGTLVIKTWNRDTSHLVTLFYVPDDNKITAVEFVGVGGAPDTWTMDTPKVINGLPAVSGSDNGKVLGVDNGEYALVDTKFEVPFTLDMANGTVSTTVSIADIYTAYNADKEVVGAIDWGNGIAEVRLSFCGSAAAYFVGTGELGNGDCDLYIDGTNSDNADTWTLRIGGTGELKVPLNSVSGADYAVTNIITAYQMGYKVTLLLDDLYNLPLVYVNAGSVYFGGTVPADNGGTLTAKNVVVRGTSGSPDTWTIEGLT